MASPLDSQYDSIRSRIFFYADKYGIDRNIGVWQLWQENRFRSTGCSGAGACGIAQFISATAARFGVDRNDVESSLDGWGRYMRVLLDMFGGSYEKALAGYNAGEGNVKKYGGIPPFTETRNYVSTILANAGLGAGSVSGAASALLDGSTAESLDPLVLYAAGAVLLFLMLDG